MGLDWKALKRRTKQNIYLNIWSRAFIRLYKSSGTLWATWVATDRHPLYSNTYVCPRGCNIAYLSISKTGCSSIRKALLDCDMPNVAISDNQEVHRYAKSIVKHRLRGADQQRFTFTFVRNPFTRIVSLYNNKFRSLKNFDVEGFLYADYLNGVFNPQMSFTAFVETLVKIPDRLADSHFKSQFSSIYQSADKKVDFIGHFEALSQDFEKLRQQFPALGPLPHFNRSHEGTDYRTYYSKRTAQLIAERYRADIEEFGYREYAEDLMQFLERQENDGNANVQSIAL